VEIYGAVRDAKLTLFPSPRMALNAGPVALAGFAEPAWVEVHVSQPIVAGPFVLSAYRDISRDVRHWPKSSEDYAAVSMEPPSTVDVVQPYVAMVPCAALTMETRAFDAFAALGDPATARHAALKAGRRIALHETANGQVLAHVTLAAGPEAVHVYAQEGSSSHVAFGRGTVVVHGWVSAEDLEPFTGTPEQLPHLVTVGTNADRFDAPVQKEARVCPHDVTLMLMEPKGRAPQQLGRIPLGTRIGIVLWDHALTTVFIPDAGIFPVGDGTLVIPTKDLDGCTAP